MLCGIIGYTGHENAPYVLLKSLRSLEYRGYDSVGMATISDSLNIRKGVVKIDKAVNDMDLENLNGTLQ